MPDLEGTVDRRAMPARFGCPWSALAKIDGLEKHLETHQLNHADGDRQAEGLLDPDGGDDREPHGCLRGQHGHEQHRANLLLDLEDRTYQNAPSTATPITIGKAIASTTEGVRPRRMRVPMVASITAPTPRRVHAEERVPETHPEHDHEQDERRIEHHPQILDGKILRLLEQQGDTCGLDGELVRAEVASAQSTRTVESMDVLGESRWTIQSTSFATGGSPADDPGNEGHATFGREDEGRRISVS